MAISYCNLSPIHAGIGSVVGKALYASRANGVDATTGVRFAFSHLNEKHPGSYICGGWVCPDGVTAPERVDEFFSAALELERTVDRKTGEIRWKGGESRRSEVAKDFVLPLPKQDQLTNEERQELVERFIRREVTCHGLAARYDIHAPDSGDVNYHAHILVAKRTYGPNGFGAKSIELDGPRRRINGIDKWPDIWAHLQNAYAQQKGYEWRVDPKAIEPGQHIGTGSNRAEKIREEEAERRVRIAAEYARNPAVVLEQITKSKAVFSRQDIAREIGHFIDDGETFSQVEVKALASSELVELAANAYSTRSMIALEKRMVQTAEDMHREDSHRLSRGRIGAVLSTVGAGLTGEQRDAVMHVLEPGQLRAVIGHAGTGKSRSLRVARAAWEADGYTVKGLSFSGQAAAELERSAGIESATIASFRWQWDRRAGGKAMTNERAQLTARDVVVIDEAAMSGSTELERLLSEARQAGAKVVLVGDPGQLQPIAAGGAFRAIEERTGAARLENIQRQRADQEWMRDASRAFAVHHVEVGLKAYRERGYERWSYTRDAAAQDLVRSYLADDTAYSEKLILAHANKDVNALNDAVRVGRKERGELAGGRIYETRQGMREFATGDRILFRKNDRELGVVNGSRGMVREIETGALMVDFDDGRTKAVRIDTYNDIDHGYASTVHKSQGMTVDRSYVLASPGFRANMVNVALTRHRDQATIFASQDDFESKNGRFNHNKFIWMMSRADVAESTLDYGQVAAERQGVETTLAGRIERREFLRSARERIQTAAESVGRAIHVIRERVSEKWGKSVVERPLELPENLAEKPRDLVAEYRDAIARVRAHPPSRSEGKQAMADRNRLTIELKAEAASFNRLNESERQSVERVFRSLTMNRDRGRSR